VRLRHPDGTIVHVAYCTNVHPAEDLDGVVDQLGRFAGPVRERLGTDLLGVGLWLARDVARTLRAAPGAVARLQDELASQGLEVVTLNGFPYAGFHDARVKKAVYRPDWSEPERLEYTLDLAWVLAALLPKDAARGSISTLPLGWREPWGADRHSASVAQLGLLAEGLAAVHDETGRMIRLALEPEPGCVVENSEQAAARWGPLASEVVGVCLDACHLAVGFEEPVPALARLSAAGLDVVKVQASAALHVDDPADPASRAALGRFAEERFLHQVRERTDAAPLARDDLPDALAGPDLLPGEDAWRVHFHVPMHSEPELPLRSTRDHLDATLGALFGGDTARTDHVELETYTWGVLPIGSRPQDDDGLVGGIAAELAWVRDRLLSHGMTEAT